MSYDLCFWREERATGLTPKEIYIRAADGEFVEGLADLPIDDIILAFQNAFPELDPTGDCPRPVGAFQVHTSTQTVFVHCYGAPVSDINQIIDIMVAFRCPLYDPQVDERFQLPT